MGFQPIKGNIQLPPAALLLKKASINMSTGAKDSGVVVQNRRFKQVKNTSEATTPATEM